MHTEERDEKESTYNSIEASEKKKIGKKAAKKNEKKSKKKMGRITIVGQK